MFKNILKICLFTIFSLSLLFVFSPSEVEAAKFVTESYTLESDEILHEDLYVTGTAVNINGIVNGDVYIAASDVSISGTIRDDAYIGAEDVTISGNVYGDLVVAGATITTSGSFGENVYMVGGCIKVDSSVVDDLVLVGGDILVDGYVEEDLIALGGDVVIESTISEDLLAYGMSLAVSNATVSGETYQEEGDYSTQDFDFVFNPGLSWSTLISTTLLVAASFYLVGALFIYLMPVKTFNIVSRATSSGENFIKSFAIGFVVLFIAFIPTILLLSITVIGIPLACILSSVLIFLTIYARLWVEIGLGKLILKYMGEKSPSPYLSLFVGRCLSIVVNLIPLVGTIYTMVLTLVGVGAFFSMKFDLMNPPKKKVSKTKTKKK